MAFVDALGDAQQLVDLFFLTAREAVDAHLPPGIQRDAARAGHLEHIIQLAHGLRQRKSTHVIPRHARKVKQRAEGIVVLCVLHALCRYCVAGEIQRDVPACERVAACEIHICAEYDCAVSRSRPPSARPARRLPGLSGPSTPKQRASTVPLWHKSQRPLAAGMPAGASTVPPFGPAALSASQRYTPAAVAGYKAASAPGPRRPHAA